MDTISVIGLGYAGLNAAVHFAKKNKVIGFDIDKVRIKELQAYYDRHNEFSEADLREASIDFTHKDEDLSLANFHILLVPTPINVFKEPNLSYLQSATRLLAKRLKKGDIVVYESTVYPGVTEEICLPLLEEGSGLICGENFYLGYSPERITPGDKCQTFENTIKIVSGYDQKSLTLIRKKYEEVVQAGVFCASNIQIAEIAKVIENCQRDVNIAFMNEISKMMHYFGLDSQEAIDAAKTKWNFLPFEPGLVGGHCISVVPYYLLYRAKTVGYHPELLSRAREVNDGMGEFLAKTLIEYLQNFNIPLLGAKVAILGVTYKKDSSDIRNIQILDIVKDLQAAGMQVQLVDPVAHPEEAFEVYKIPLSEWEDLQDLSGMIITVAHKAFEDFSNSQYIQKFSEQGIIMDVKGFLSPESFKGSSVTLWRL